MGIIEITFNGSSESISFTPNNYNNLKEHLYDLSPDQVSFLIAMGAPVDIDWENDLF